LIYKVTKSKTESEVLGWWVARGRQIGNKNFKGDSVKLLEIHRNERCEEVSSREWEQIHEKSVSQTGGTWNLKKFGCGRAYNKKLSYRRETARQLRIYT